MTNWKQAAPPGGETLLELSARGLRTYGAGDPKIPRHLEKLHDEAQRSGSPFYLDPDLGLWVQTSDTLRKNGKCCGQACRHCPYDRAEQSRAERPLLRPEGS